MRPPPWLDTKSFRRSINNTSDIKLPTTILSLFLNMGRHVLYLILQDGIQCTNKKSWLVTYKQCLEEDTGIRHPVILTGVLGTLKSLKEFPFFYNNGLPPSLSNDLSVLFPTGDIHIMKSPVYPFLSVRSYFLLKHVPRSSFFCVLHKFVSCVSFTVFTNIVVIP